MFINLTCPCSARYPACSVSITSSITTHKNMCMHTSRLSSAVTSSKETYRLPDSVSELLSRPVWGRVDWMVGFLAFRSMGLHPCSCGLLYRYITCPIRLWVNGQVSCLLALVPSERIIINRQWCSIRDTLPKSLLKSSSHSAYARMAFKDLLFIKARASLKVYT